MLLHLSRSLSCTQLFLLYEGKHRQTLRSMKGYCQPFLPQLSVGLTPKLLLWSYQATDHYGNRDHVWKCWSFAWQEIRFGRICETKLYFKKMHGFFWFFWLIDGFIDETTQMICNTQPLPEIFWIWCRRTPKKINKKNIQKIFMLAQVASQKGDQCVFHLCSFETRSLPQNHPTPGLFHPSSCQLWLCISDDTRGFNHLKCKNPVHVYSNISTKNICEPRAI